MYVWIYIYICMPTTYLHACILTWMHVRMYVTTCVCVCQYVCRDRGADKSLARPGRKQANISVGMAWISFGALPCRKKKAWWQFASRCCWNRARPWHASEFVSFLFRLKTYQHPGTFIGIQRKTLDWIWELSWFLLYCSTAVSCTPFYLLRVSRHGRGLSSADWKASFKWRDCTGIWEPYVDGNNGSSIIPSRLTTVSNWTVLSGKSVTTVYHATFIVV